MTATIRYDQAAKKLLTQVREARRLQIREVCRDARTRQIHEILAPRNLALSEKKVKVFYTMNFHVADMEMSVYNATAPHKRTTHLRTMRKQVPEFTPLPDVAVELEEPTLTHEGECIVPLETQSLAYPMFEQFSDLLSNLQIHPNVALPMRQFFGSVVGQSTRSLIAKHIPMNLQTDLIMDKIENALLLWYYFFKAQTTTERCMAAVMFAKITNNGLDDNLVATTAFMAAFNHFIAVDEAEEPLAPQGNTLPLFDSMREFLDRWESVRAAPIFSKLYKFSMYTLATSIFAPLGLTMDLFKFDNLAKEAMRKKFHMGPDMIHSILDTLLFLCERGYQCYQTGTIMPLFHNAAKYQEWYDTAERLVRQSHFLSNPEVHGINRFSFLADLKDSIEKGQSIRRCVTAKDERLIVSRLLATLELTHDMEVTKRSAQKDRKSPFCVLLYGGSSIGKSTLQNVLFQQYGKLRKLNTASEFKYVRNPTEAFWSGMNSTQWCIVLDDIAFLSPSLGVLDPSLAEMLCIANNVPFVPAQADLADKGRTPVLAEFVIGSTNTETLNLHAFFSCPLAVQRRFPWILDVTVKREYQSFDRPGMLDSSKVPSQVVGSYPDFWNFTLKRVEPVGEDRLHQAGRTMEVAQFTSMRDLLVWFNQAVIDHNDVQTTIMKGNATMDATELCECCSLPTSWCMGLTTQSAESVAGHIEGRDTVPTYMNATPITAVATVVEQASWSTRLSIFWLLFLYVVWCMPILGWFTMTLLGEFWWHNLAASSPHRQAVLRVVMRYAGYRVQRAFGGSGTLKKIAVAVSACLSLYALHGAFLRNFWSMAPQGGVGSVHAEPKPTCEKMPEPDNESRTTPSYASPYPFCNADLSQTTLCAKGSDPLVLKRNIARATVMFRSSQDTKVHVTTAINVRGSVYMCNYHGIPQRGDFYLDIVCEERCLVRPSTRQLLVTEDMVVRVPDHDLAFVCVRARPPGTDLTPYFVGKDYTGCLDGVYIGRDVTGKQWENPIVNLKRHDESWKTHAGEKVTRSCWLGVASTMTSVGDCGSTLFSQTPSGPVILGIHTLGGGSRVGCMSVSREVVQENCDKLQPRFVSRGAVQVSAPSCARNVGDLSPQSVIHMSKPGTGLVHGSFTGEFRQRGRTSVGPTFICAAAKRAGYVEERTVPDMTRTPWLLALNDMTRPVTLMRNSTLIAARDMFIEETTLADVSKVHVYPLHVAINGAPGVLYCDKMNRTSSAGAPYKKSKKHFMYYLDEATSTDMWVTQEVEDTVHAMVATYQRGERVHPVYVGHLKDEPVTFEKARAGKTRVFTASGIAYTLVVRQYLLSVIVYMQTHRYVYETGPGTIAQSLEWEEMYRYLTAHGCDRIVAGDYSKFDKRMPANVILAAFEVIEELCQRAGYTEADLMVVRGIAYDTAFPVVDFNGDLIEFYGSNPSGHPLTVIINGLANSLYMRYCYLILRPLGNNETFKRNVNLMTYGDDNIMGVTCEAEWFNHTAIQAELASVDIGYTMAEKEAKSVPFITIGESSFLKRTWRWDEDLGCHVAPLDHASINKMLTVCTRSKNVSQQAQSISVVSTAVREYFWYGRVQFEEKKELLMDIVSEAGLDLYVEDSTFPQWDDLVREFAERSSHVRL